MSKFWFIEYARRIEEWERWSDLSVHAHGAVTA